MNLIFKDREWALSGKAVDACVKLFGGAKKLKAVNSRAFLLAAAHNQEGDARDLYEVAMRCFLLGDQLRPALAVAHIGGNVAWGTNAHTAIGLPLERYTPPAHEHKYVDVAGVVHSLDGDIAYLGYDVQGLLGADVWGVMEKWYVRGALCKDCEGKGERRCDMGHEHECEICRGEGYMHHYSGLLQPEQLDNVRVGAQVMRSRYVHRVLSVCEMLGLPEVTRTKGCRKGTLWMSGKVQFLIMPINDDHLTPAEVRDLGAVKQAEPA